MLRQHVNDKNIPDMSIYEASEFWDEHEFSEYDDVQEVHDLQFSLRNKEKRLKRRFE